MRGELQRAMEAELGLTSTYEEACIGPDYNMFRSGARSCPHCRPHFRSTNRASQYEQYGLIIDMGVHLSMIQGTEDS